MPKEKKQKDEYEVIDKIILEEQLKRQIKAEILKAAKSSIDEDAVGKYAEFYLNDILDLFEKEKANYKKELREKIGGIKIQSHTYRIPCPEGIPGCLVIHYSKDTIITPEERKINQSIDEILKLLK